MRTPLPRLVTPACLCLFAAAQNLTMAQTVGQQEQESTDSGQAPVRVAPHSITERPDGDIPAISRRNASAERHVAQLRRLQQAMKKRLRLSDKQTEAIDRLFLNHLDSLENRQSRHRPFGVDPGDAEKMTQLREKLTAARQAGDTQRLTELREEFRRMMRSRQTAIGVTSDQFIARIIQELEGNQIGPFRALVKQLRIGDGRGTPTPRLRALWRALAHPSLQLASEQKAAVRKIRARSKSLEAGARSAAARLDAGTIAAQARADVNAVLNTEQRGKLAALLGSQRGRPRDGAPRDAGVQPSEPTREQPATADPPDDNGQQPDDDG